MGIKYFDVKKKIATEERSISVYEKFLLSSGLLPDKLCICSVIHCGHEATKYYPFFLVVFVYTVRFPRNIIVIEVFSEKVGMSLLVALNIK